MDGGGRPDAPRMSPLRRGDDELAQLRGDGDVVDGERPGVPEVVHAGRRTMSDTERPDGAEEETGTGAGEPLFIPKTPRTVS